jgi:hypothetical protein
MNFLKKLTLSFLASLIIFQSFALYSPVKAAGQWYDSDPLTWFIKVYDTQTSQPQEIFGERYTAAQVQWVIYSLIVIPINAIFNSEFTACLLNAVVNNSPIQPCLLIPAFGNNIKAFLDLINEVITTNPSTEPLAGGQTSKLAFLASTITQAKPVSGVTYFSNMINRASLVPEVQAQAGYGYGAISILQPMWGKTRDIAYALLIFVAIIMAFMIMMRTKISPQAVITVQTAIPKLIGAIILITFSYAIAGLMIDIMYVVIGLIATIASSTPDEVASIYKTLTDGPGGTGLFGLGMLYSFLVPLFVAVSLSGLPTSITSFQLFLVLFMVIFLILAIVLIFAFLKIWMMLIKTLVSVYLQIIFAPFYILGGAVTGALGFGQWLKDLAGNLAVFPAVGILFLFSFTFLNAVYQSAIGQFPEPVRGYLSEIFNRMFGTISFGSIGAVPTEGWAPPYLGLGASSGNFMMIMVSVGIILLIPKVADIIKSFMSGRPFAYGSAIGEAVTGGVAGAAGAIALPSQAKKYYKDVIKGGFGIGRK